MGVQYADTEVVNSRSLLPGQSAASWQSLVEDLADGQAMLYGPDEAHLREQPGDPALDIEIATVETELRYRLPAEYREFLTVVGGWAQMHEDTHALSPADLLDGPLHRRSLEMLSVVEDVVLVEHGIRLQDLLPIAVSTSSLDLHAVIIRGPKAGSVLWTIGWENTLFPTVRDWLAGLIEDTERMTAEVLDFVDPTQD